MADTLALGPLGQIAVTVDDLDVAVPFYRDALGVPMLFQVPNLAFFDCGGVRLMLSTPEPGQGRGNSVLYFRVADIQAAYTTLQERGVTFVDAPHIIAEMPDHDLWMAFFRDPGGNMHGLMAEVKREK